MDPAKPILPLSWLGLFLFLLGMAINLHSDSVLRGLRAPGETGYRIPYGGLFSHISAPNYFGETLEWCGFAAVAQVEFPSLESWIDYFEDWSLILFDNSQPNDCPDTSCPLVCHLESRLPWKPGDTDAQVVSAEVWRGIPGQEKSLHSFCFVIPNIPVSLDKYLIFFVGLDCFSISVLHLLAQTDLIHCLRVCELPHNSFEKVQNPNCL